MESFEVVLLLIGCVLVSSVFDQVLSRVSLPLVQIALGAAVGFVISDDPTAVFSDPELFLLLFIAPLLFDESRHADKTALWKNKAMIASLAIGLVIVTMLIVGFVLNLIVPSVPLAAAFALGAALGPTDAAAVAAMGKDVSLSKKQESLLSGEALFNDASGVVSFEFALAAAVTGAFSLVDASVTFVFDFFGGILVGLALAALVMFVLGRVRSLGLETPTVFVLFEVCTPFVTFLAAEALRVSGILAVVAAGLFMKFYPSALTLESSRYAVASKSVWELLVFAINGIVFVLLGMKLPDVILPTWNSAGSEGGVWLVGLVLVVTVLVVGVRFVWVLGMEWAGARRRVPTREAVVDAVATTLSGPKGAVTLSIVLTFPYLTAAGAAFPERDLLIFVASGVILCTLLLANFIVPLLAPADEQDAGNDSLAQVKAEILQNVISELLEESTPETALSTQAAVRAYRDRLDATRESSVPDGVVRKVRIMMLADQVEFVEDQMKRGVVSRSVGERYAGSLERMIAALGGRKWDVSVERASGAGAVEGDGASGIVDKVAAGASDIASQVVAGASNVMSRVTAGPVDRLAHKKVPVTWIIRSVLGKIGGSRMADDRKREVLQLHMDVNQRALRYLATVEPHLSDDGQRAVSLIREEVRSRFLRDDLWSTSGASSALPVASQGPSSRFARKGRRPNRKQVEAKVRDVEAEALGMELEQIKLMREAGRLTSRDARELREEVYMLQMGLEAR